jgi:DNA-binding response OmpR family regulator
MNQSILVVDDDPVVRDIVREYLQGRGFSVTALEHGIALQRALENERPALVVLDIMMPEMDGISALRALRLAGDDIPVILLTARADVIDRVIGLELGADDYLGKPFEPSELVARIRTVLRRRGTIAPALERICDAQGVRHPRDDGAHPCAVAGKAAWQHRGASQPQPRCLDLAATASDRSRPV